MLGTVATCPVPSKDLDHCPGSKWAGRNIRPQNSCYAPPGWGLEHSFQFTLQETHGFLGGQGEPVGSWCKERGREAGSPVLSGE